MTIAAHKRILATGVFDLFHVGHLRYLKYARQQGSSLVVGVVRDEDVLRTKGKMPCIPLAQRMEIIDALACVDEVRVQPTSTHDIDAAQVWIPQWGCQHVVVGGMWKEDPNWQVLASRLAQQRITVDFAPATEGISSSLIKAGLGATSHGDGRC